MTSSLTTKLKALLLNRQDLKTFSKLFLVKGIKTSNKVCIETFILSQRIHRYNFSGRIRS